MTLPTMHDIAIEVAASHGLTLQQLRTRRRTKLLAHARQQAMWAMRQEKRWSSIRIGDFFGVKHSTVLYGVKAYERRAQALARRP